MFSQWAPVREQCVVGPLAVSVDFLLIMKEIIGRSLGF